MKQFLMILVISMASGFDIPYKNCNAAIEIDYEYYNLVDTIDLSDGYPSDAHFDSLGNLFFVKSGRRVQEYYYDIYIIENNSTEAVKVLGLPNCKSYSIALDKKEGRVLFGTAEGIYKYNYDSNQAERFSEKGLKINMIFVDSDSNIYVTESYNGVEELYLLQGNKKVRLSTMEAINELGISENNEFYYIMRSKLFVLKPTSSVADELTNVTYNGLGQINFYNNKVFIASQSLKYFYNNNVKNIYTVENLPEKITAVSFDLNGNFVTGTKGKLLKYEKSVCYFKKNKQ